MKGGVGGRGIGGRGCSLLMIEYGIVYVCGIHGKDLGLIKGDDCMNNDF